MNTAFRNTFDIHFPRTLRSIFSAAICLAAVLLSATEAFAQSTESDSLFPTNARKFYAFGAIAGFDPETNNQLQHQHGDGASLIAGGGFRFSPLLSLELDYLVAGQRLDTPPAATPAPGTYTDGTLKTSMETQGLAVSVKFNFPAGRFDPYVAAGAGWYTTRFRTTSEAPGCQRHCEDTGPRITRRSNDPGYHAALGADIHITAKDIVSAELRYLRLRATFDDVVPGTVNAGGTFLSVGYRRYF